MSYLTTQFGPLRLAGGLFLALNGAEVQAPQPPAGPIFAPHLADFAVGHSLARFVIQRAAGTYNDAVAGQAGSANITVPFTVTSGAPSVVEARIVDFDNAATVIVNWTPLAGLDIATGRGKLAAVPSGCDYRLELRATGGTVTFDGDPVRWGVGPRVAAMGQSNMIRLLDAGAYQDNVAGTAKSEYQYITDTACASAFFGTNGYVVPQNLGGTGADTPYGSFNIATGGVLKLPRVLAKALLAKHGRKIPVAVIPLAINATSIDAFIPTAGSAVSALFGNSGTTIGNFGLASPGCGDFEVLAWHQGEADHSVGRSAYKAKAIQMVDGCLAHVAQFGRTPQQFTFVPGILGAYGDTAGVNFIENIRGAVYDVLAYAQSGTWARVTPFNGIDLDASAGTDPLHIQDLSGGHQFKRWGLARLLQSALYSMGLSSFDGMGPRIASMSRAGDVVTVTVNNAQGPIGARNPANPITGIYANRQADFTGVDVVPTVAITAADKFTLTFPAGTFAGGAKVYIKAFGGDPGAAQSYRPNVTNPLVDAASYPTAEPQFIGLPLQYTPQPIEVA